MLARAFLRAFAVSTLFFVSVVQARAKALAVSTATPAAGVGRAQGRAGHTPVLVPQVPMSAHDESANGGGDVPGRGAFGSWTLEKLEGDHEDEGRALAVAPHGPCPPA